MRSLQKLAHVLISIAGIYYFIVVGAGVLVHPQNADMAVVLGNEVLADGELSDRLTARVDCALTLYKQKRVPLIMVSGGKGVSGFDEAQSMADYLKSKDVPESDIIIDSEGVNTMATAINAAKIMKERHMKSAVLVTQYFHIPRTELAFSMAGVKNYSADYPVFYEFRDIPSTLREMVAIPTYWFTKPHSN